MTIRPVQRVARHSDAMGTVPYTFCTYKFFEHSGLTLADAGRVMCLAHLRVSLESRARVAPHSVEILIYHAQNRLEPLIIY